MFLIICLSFITIVVSLSQLISFQRMYSYVRDELVKPRSQYHPKVTVILPCKGLDQGFESNVRNLLQQEYRGPHDGLPNFEVVFAVASIDDPAFPVLTKLLTQTSHVRTQLVVAGVNSECAQKINNQLCALNYIAADTEVLVFVDSDVIARPDFLAYLVSPLAQEGIGITTGYRFYIPFRGDLPSLLRSLWNRVSAWELANERFTFAWGGAMAIKKSVFELAKVASHWQKAADDDLSMTVAVKQLGFKVHFVPQCLVASNGDASLREVVEWLNRQLILTKVYYPALWQRGVLKAGILAFWLVALLWVSLRLLYGWEEQAFWALTIGLSILPVEIYFLIRAQSLWRLVLSTESSLSEQTIMIEKAYDRSFLKYLIALPFAHLVLPWLTLYSLLTNRIRWRGITYELRSSTETIVI